MTRFSYVARDSGGKSITGMLTAPTPAAASKQLRQEGKFLVRLQAGGTAASAPAAAPHAARAPAAPTRPAPPAIRMSSRRINRKDVIFLTNQLAVMAETGVPLADALDAVVEQSNSIQLRSVLGDVAQRVQSGEEFSAALARHGRVFPPMYVAMVKAAEASGTLGIMLDRAGAYFLEEHETRKKVKGALTYPAAMLIFAITVTVFLMAFVLPRFTAIYATREAALPMPTKVVMAISKTLVNHWLALAAGLAALIVSGILFFRREAGRQWWAAARLKVPLIGGMFHKVYITRCLRTLGALIGTGVSMLDAVQITREVSGRGPFARLWDEVDKSLRGGQQLSEPLFRSRLMPRSITQMLVAGERSGKLPDVMERVSRFCDHELKTQIQTVTAMIEPIMIVLMGAIIGFVVMALLLPIFSISKVLTQH